MVTLERIDTQKKFLKRFFSAKGKRTGYGRELPAGSMAMHNISFGTKGRFQALIVMLQNELNNQIRHFGIEGSSIQSAKLVAALEELTMNDSRTIQSLMLTDLSVPIKKATVSAITNRCASLTSKKVKIVIERCMGSENVI